MMFLKKSNELKKSKHMGHGQNVWDKVKTYGTWSKRMWQSQNVMGQSQSVMGQSQIVWDKVKSYGTKSNRMGQSQIVWDKVKSYGTKSNRMGQSVVILNWIKIPVYCYSSSVYRLEGEYYWDNKRSVHFYTIIFIDFPQQRCWLEFYKHFDI